MIQCRLEWHALPWRGEAEGDLIAGSFLASTPSPPAPLPQGGRGEKEGFEEQSAKESKQELIVEC